MATSPKQFFCIDYKYICTDGKELHRRTKMEKDRTTREMEENCERRESPLPLFHEGSIGSKNYPSGRCPITIPSETRKKFSIQKE